MNRQLEIERTGKEVVFETVDKEVRPDTGAGIGSRISDYRRVNVEPAQDQLFRIAAKLAFVRESAPVIHTTCEFSRLGLDGMSFILESVLDDIQEAGEFLDRMSSNQPGTEATGGDHA